MLTLIQMLWTVLLALWASLLAWNGHLGGVAILLLAAANAYVALQSRKGAKWALWASWPLPICALILVGPMVAKNFYLYFMDDPAYLNSPGTICACYMTA